MITPNQVLEANQILSLHAAESLIGKRIAVTAHESIYNSEIVRWFTIFGFISEWDKAANEECKGFASRQDYWASHMTEQRINQLKNTLLIITEYDLSEYWDKVAIRCHDYMQSVFTGSDVDRFVYYIILPNED